MAREVGRPRNMNEPKELLDLWIEYKTYIDTNPDREEVVTVKGDIVEKRTKKPYLKQGFISFVFRKLGKNIKDYVDNKYPEFSDVVTHIRSEWEEDQISGTITGKYKAPNLVARLNNLKEQTETEIKGTLNIPNLPDIGDRK